MRNTLLELWKSSTIIQGIMALGTVGVVLYLVATGQPVPEVVTGLLMVIVGYYFGSKSQQNQNIRGK